MPASLPGIHHVTSITGDVQACVDFYVNVLGLRFVKKSINQDVPDTYHIYFGDYAGSPGTAMTFFGWPSWPARRAGSGQVTTVSFAVPADSLEFWAGRPVDRDHAIRGFHSVTMTVAETTATADLLVNTMGFRKAGQEGRRTRFETGEGGQHSILDLVESPEGPEGEESIGTVHHVAWRATDAAHQAEW